jgi:hypothetical protein
MASTVLAKPGHVLQRPCLIVSAMGDDCITTIRCNGRDFHIEMSPFYICNLPTIESRYRKVIAAVRDEYGTDTEDEKLPTNRQSDSGPHLNYYYEPG